MLLKGRILVFLITVALLSTFSESAAVSSEESPLEVPRFEPVAATDDFPVKVPNSYRSERGYLVVLEDRNRSEGPTVRLPVVVVKSKATAAGPGPVLYLSGGPGTSGLTVAQYPAAYPFLQHRDLVVIGQRGTRHAIPSLECPEYAGALGAVDPQAEPSAQMEILKGAARTCRSRFVDAGIDLGAYHTAASAADVEDLRQVLGIQQWTLYGVSYGTRLGLAIVRDFPGSVRAAILDSPLPPQVRYDDESASHLEAALQLVFRDCQVSESCREAFPKLRERFYSALARADREPLVIATQVGDEKVPKEYRGAELATLVQLGSPTGIAYAPLLLDAVARRDAELLTAVVGTSGASSPFAWGMRLSVWCGEALPHSLRVRASGPSSILGGVESAVILPEICSVWRVPTRPASETHPVVSQIPTLLVAGEYDPATPPAWAFEAARTLVNSRVAVIRGAGHLTTQDWSGDRCAMKLADQFARDPLMITQTDASLPPCLASQGHPEFTLTVTEEPRS